MFPFDGVIMKNDFVEPSMVDTDTANFNDLPEEMIWLKVSQLS